MFASIFTLHPNLSTTLSSHHLYSHWCKRQSESAVERKLPSIWYAEGEMLCALTSLCAASVWPLVTTNVGEHRDNFFFLCLPSHVIYLCPVQRRPSLPRVLQHWPEPFSLSLQPSLIIKGETHSELSKGRYGYSEQMHWWQRKGH